MSSSSYKHVAFGELKIREYPLILGDNPACSDGAPVTLGWKYDAAYERNLEFYEYTRQAERRSKCPKISVQKRAQLLLAAGYSLEQIGAAVLKVEEAKKMRSDSLKAMGFGERTKMILESTGRIPKDLLTGMAGLLVANKPPTSRSSITARSA
jgi:hypothetical protein